MDTLRLTLVTPERAVLDRVSCETVTLPAERGEIGILPGHAALITLLGVGVVAYRVGGGGASVAVRDGFAEIVADDVRILADEAATRDLIDASAVAEEKREAEAERLTVVGEERLDAVNAAIAYADARLKVASG